MSETETAAIREELRQWHKSVIGYDPFAEGWSVEEVCEIRAEYDAATAP